MKSLATKQQQILSFIRIYNARKGESPTVREISAMHSDLAPQTAW